MSCFCRSLVPYGTGARVDWGRRAGLASGCIRRGVAAQQRARGAQEHETAVFAEVQRHDDLDFLDETLTCGELLLLSIFPLNRRTTVLPLSIAAEDGLRKVPWVCRFGIPRLLRG